VRLQEKEKCAANPSGIWIKAFSVIPTQMNGTKQHNQCHMEQRNHSAQLCSNLQKTKSLHIINWLFKNTKFWEMQKWLTRITLLKWSKKTKIFQLKIIH
jgi:hypothetical protein